jgi:hypothetical protein
MLRKPVLCFVTNGYCDFYQIVDLVVISLERRVPTEGVVLTSVISCATRPFPCTIIIYDYS